MKFTVKRIFRNKRIVSMDFGEAIKTVNNVYQKPETESIDNYKNPTINESKDLSIVIPVYNKKNLVHQCIDSVLNQNTTYTYEIIIVDDGSTDGAREVVLSYKGVPGVKILLQDNQGIAGARNLGIDSADGIYLMFIDCDDYVYEDMVQTMLDEAYKHSCDMVMCGHNLSKESNGKVYQIIPYIYPVNNLFKYQHEYEILNYAGLPWGKVYKRSLWNSVRFLKGYWFEDTIIQWLLFPQCKTFSYIPKVEYEYRWYADNFSKVQGRNSNPKSIDRYWMLTDIVSKYINMGLETNAMFYTLLLKHLSSFYYSNISGLDSKLIDALFVLARELLVKYRPITEYKLPYMLQLTEKALIQGDINLWILTSQYQ